MLLAAAKKMGKGPETLTQVSVPFFADVKDGGIPRSGEVEIEGQVIQGSDQGLWFEYRSLDSIPFHLNIRLGQNKEHVTIVNSFDRGRWRREVRQPNNVSIGGPIKLQVINHWSSWEIIINGKSFSFSHRLPAKNIRRLEIRGDIRIDRMTLKHLDGQILAYQQQHSPPQPFFNPPPYSPDGSDYGTPGMAPVPGIEPVHTTGPQPGLQPAYQPNTNQPGYGEPVPNQHGGGLYPSLGQPTPYGQPHQNSSDPRGYY